MALPYENLSDYFEELLNPTLQEAIQQFFTEVSTDCQWCQLFAPQEIPPQSKDVYAKKFKDASTFVNNLLNAFGIAPVCNICPGQDGRAGYILHVCGVNHFKYLSEKLAKDKARYANAANASTEIQKQYWQSWTFVLGEVKINYFTGDVLARRRPSYLGIKVRLADQLPSAGMGKAKRCETLVAD